MNKLGKKAIDLKGSRCLFQARKQGKYPSEKQEYFRKTGSSFFRIRSFQKWLVKFFVWY